MESRDFEVRKDYKHSDIPEYDENEYTISYYGLFLIE